MQIKSRQYPHPVLSPFSDDFVGCKFETEIENNATKDLYQFKIIFKTDCQDLKKLIKESKVYYAFHVECPSTRYRKIFHSFDEELFVKISTDDLDGKVEMCTVILAAKDIDNYSTRNFHSDYDGISFEVKKGDVLAFEKNRYFYAEKTQDPLVNVRSIFSIKLNPNKEDSPPFEIDLTGNKILIYLSHENYERFAQLKLSYNLQSVLASIIVIPALVSILEIIIGENDEYSEYEELRWYRVLSKRLENIGINLNDPNSFTDSTVAIAQKLIGDPIISALKTLEEYESDE